MPKRVVVKGEGITLDLLLWREHGPAGERLVEVAHRLNPGLAALCAPDIPVGTPVILPDRPPRDRVTPRRVVDLFG